MQGGVAPAPAPMAGPPALPKASDALALTNSTLNQLQVNPLASCSSPCFLSSTHSRVDAVTCTSITHGVVVSTACSSHEVCAGGVTQALRFC